MAITINQVKDNFQSVFNLKPVKANVLIEMPFPELLTANFNSLETWLFIQECLAFYDTVQLSKEPEVWLAEVQQDKKDKKTLEQFDNAPERKTEYSFNVSSLNNQASFKPSVSSNLKAFKNVTINLNGKMYNSIELHITIEEFYELLTDAYGELLAVEKGSIPLRLVDSLPLPSLTNVYSIEIKTKGYKVKNGKQSGYYKADGKLVAPERIQGLEENARYLQKKDDNIYCKDIWSSDFNAKKDLLSLKVNGKFYLLELRKITPNKVKKNDADQLDKLITVKAREFYKNITETKESYSQAILCKVNQSNFFYRYANNKGMITLTLTVTNKGNVYCELTTGYTLPILIGTIINNKITTKKWHDTTHAKIAHHINNKDMDNVKLELKTCFGGNGKLTINNFDANYNGRLVARATENTSQHFIPTVQFLNEIAIQSGLQSYDLNWLKCDHVRQQIGVMLNKFNHKLVITQSYNKDKIKDLRRMLTKILGEFIPSITLDKSVNTILRVVIDNCNGDLKLAISYLMPTLNYIKGKTSDDTSYEQFKIAIKSWVS